jgi:hypothetical protein
MDQVFKSLTENDDRVVTHHNLGLNCAKKPARPLRDDQKTKSQGHSGHFGKFVS